MDIGLGMYLPDLILDPYGYEVAWDYCLENNIFMPSNIVLPPYVVPNSTAGTMNRSFSHDNYSRYAGVSCSGRLANRFSLVNFNLEARSGSGRAGTARSCWN